MQKNPRKPRNPRPAREAVTTDAPPAQKPTFIRPMTPVELTPSIPRRILVGLLYPFLNGPQSFAGYVLTCVIGVFLGWALAYCVF